MKGDWIYSHDENLKVRYTLGQKGKKLLICLGLNPSVAVPNQLDRTLNKVKAIAEYNNYDGWVMINVYPLIETKSDNLVYEKDSQIVENNLNEIGNILKEYPNSDIWCAWGCIVEKRTYLKECLEEVLSKILKEEFSKRKFCCVSTTKKGHPRHPLFCKKESKLIKFEIEKYEYKKK